MVWELFAWPQSGLADMALPELGRYGLKLAKKNARGASSFMTSRRRQFHFSFGGFCQEPRSGQSVSLSEGVDMPFTRTNFFRLSLMHN